MFFKRSYKQTCHYNFGPILLQCETNKGDIRHIWADQVYLG